jgi:UDP-N-acetylglucosamine 2-epimerase (non-hydrolysing)
VQGIKELLGRRRRRNCIPTSPEKAIVVTGTRPEAIKLAPVVLELERHRAHFETKICVTGQHREMLDQMVQVFGLRPSYDLGVMKAGQNLATVTATCLTGLDRIMRHERQDLVLVQGDTTTTLAASLASYYSLVPTLEPACEQGRNRIPFRKRLTTDLLLTFRISISPPRTSRGPTYSKKGSVRRTYW